MFREDRSIPFRRLLACLLSFLEGTFVQWTVLFGKTTDKAFVVVSSLFFLFKACNQGWDNGHYRG